MIDRLLSTIAPHICCSCGQDFGIMCENCISDIADDPFGQCIDCLTPTFQTNLCAGCRSVWGIAGGWAVGERRGGLRELLDRYKFDRSKAAVPVIGRLLDARLPQLPTDTAVVYIPDIPTHRRQRGYDHMKLIARDFAAHRELAVHEGMGRLTHVSQRGLSRRQRLNAQCDAFQVTIPLSGPVLLIDDILTTGSTLRAGVAALQQAGVREIYTAIIARQPLDVHDDL